MELLKRVAAHAREAPDAVAAREVGLGCGASLTYAELWRQTVGVSESLRAKVPPGEVIILVTGNRIEYFVACLAIWAAGCVVMPMHHSVAEKELVGAAQRTNAKLALVDSRYVPGQIEGYEGLRTAELREFIRAALSIVVRGQAEIGAATLNGSLPGLLLQSSGTTGLPKIVRRSRDAVDAVARNVVEAADLRRDDHVFAAVPICHAYGIENGFLAPLWEGCSVHLCDGLDVPVAMAQFAGPCSVFPGVPFMFEVLAGSESGAAAPSNKSLRLTYSAGGMLPPSIAGAFERVFGLRVGQLYGASELGSVTFNHPENPAADPLSVGRPMSGVDVRILDPDLEDSARPLGQGVEGSVAIKAPSMMSGYVDGDAPVIDGYFLTGDLGRISAEGDLTITGRLKNLIDIGGMKVNPAEVEEVLSTHESVAECVVLPIAVTPTVSRLKAIVVPALDTVDPEELRRFARERLAGHKVPRVIEVRDSLPRSPSGKILRAQLEVPS